MTARYVVLAVDWSRPVGEVRQRLARDVGLDGLADRLEQADRIVEEAAALDRVAHPREDFLLAGGTGEVALAGGLADARIGERLVAVEMVPSGRDREAAFVKPYSL